MKLQTILGLVGAVYSAVSFGASGGPLTGKIKEILVDDSRFGGCMVWVVPGPETLALDNACKSAYVSLDCAGDFGTKSSGQAKLQAAQLAYVTEQSINFYVDSTKQHNGFCVATNAQNKAPTPATQ